MGVSTGCGCKEVQYIDFLILIILLFVHFFNVFRSYSLESEVKLDSFF